jgi:gluconate 2-dehydrogenase gamma chain
MSDSAIPRRNFLKGAGFAGAAIAASEAPAQAQAPAAPAAAAKPAPEALLTLTATEAAFLSAAFDTFIPADPLSPSGTDCGLVTYWDRQLAGAYGNGARFYRSGPFIQGKPEQGYQLPLTPREYFAAGIKAANAYAKKTYGKEFDRLAPAERDAMLKDMDANKAQFEGMAAKPFLEALLTAAMEGFFSDPIHGGNRDKASWKMIGYPGLPATYARTAEQYRGKKVDLKPQSIQDFI